MATKVLEKPGRDFEKNAKKGSTAVSKSPKEFLSRTPKISSFYHTSKGFYLGTFT